MKEVKEIPYAKEQEEENLKYEAKAKSDVNVANAKKEKSELKVRISSLLTDYLSNQQQINYSYDFDLYTSNGATGTSARWFIRCQSAQSKPEKISIPKEKVPQD